MIAAAEAGLMRVVSAAGAAAAAKFWHAAASNWCVEWSKGLTKHVAVACNVQTARALHVGYPQCVLPKFHCTLALPRFFAPITTFLCNAASSGLIRAPLRS